MYSNKPEPCAIVRTAASVITAVCLLLITTSMGIAGVYTIRTVNTINTDEIHNIVTKLSSTVDSMHSGFTHVNIFLSRKLNRTNTRGCFRNETVDEGCSSNI